MSEPDELIPDAWVSGEPDEKLNKLINENVWHALKEYIEDSEPWISWENGNVETYVGVDLGGIVSKGVPMDELVFSWCRGLSNEYYGTIDRDSIKQMRDYLQAVVARIDDILEKAKDDDVPTMLSERERKEFASLFDGIPVKLNSRES